MTSVIASFFASHLFTLDMLRSVGVQTRELLQDQALWQACWSPSTCGQAKSFWKNGASAKSVTGRTVPWVSPRSPTSEGVSLVHSRL